MVRLYLDEDVNILLASLLRPRNITVTTTLERNMLGKSDREQLDFASANEAALVTHNRVDFENLFREHIEQGKRFSGIIILSRKNVYTLAQRLARFTATHEAIDNQLWYV